MNTDTSPPSILAPPSILDDNDFILSEDYSLVHCGSGFGKEEMNRIQMELGGSERKPLEDILNNPKPASESISSALQALSPVDREKVIRQIYGIDTGDDDENFVNEKLDEMETELTRLKAASSWNLALAAIELAESQNLAYVQNRSFRLLFLRSDRFNVKKAAGRFVRFFDLKLEIFGPAPLARRITIDDLTKEDRAMLKKGYFQRLPVRDSSGRTVFVSIYDGQTYENHESVMRQYFYNSACDEVTDNKQCVYVFFKIKDPIFKTCERALGGYPFAIRIMTDFPLRNDAFHKCLEKKETSVMHRVIDYLIQFFNPDDKARSSIHYGTHAEWMTRLMTYGIPHDVIPLSPSYKIKCKNFHETIAMRTKMSEMLAADPTLAPESLISLPSRSDVLLGKGKPIQFSSGNLRLQTIVDGYADAYNQKTSNLEKTALAQDIVRVVKSSGVRFLSKDKGIWMEVPDDVAREKISHIFRYQRRKAGSTDEKKTGLVRDSPGPSTLVNLVASSEGKIRKLIS